MNLEERITELEDEIRRYKIHLNKAIDDGDDQKIIIFGGLISKRADNLSLAERQLLLQREERQMLTEQQQPNRGNIL